jgi:error-prone DNA polymerase
VLQKTKGVPLFQEQAMKVAIVGAGFTPTEADALRRSMATFKATGGVSAFHDKLVNGMIANGYTRDFAERTFKQIEGFGSYGFPESHAASFAKIAYASSWVKCHHPDIFCAALLNAQPMGFYAPAQIVRDAREHGVEVRPVCVNASRWDCTVEELEYDHLKLNRHCEERSDEAIQPASEPALDGFAALAMTGDSDQPDHARLPIRLGLRMVRGLSNDHAARILAAREERPFDSVEDVWRRSGVPVAALEKLADADAFAGLGLDRRQALWRVRGLGEAPLPLFAAADARDVEPEVRLAPLTAGREVVEDYRAVQLTLRDHPLSFVRPELDRRGSVPCSALKRIKDGRKVRLSGIVLIRQRPGAGNVTFVTIEDEGGIANIIIWQRLYETYRRTVLSAAMIGVEGRVQKEGDVIHVIADRIEDESFLLRAVGDRDFPHRTAPGDGAKGGGPDHRQRGPLPLTPYRKAEGIRIKSRDFH